MTRALPIAALLVLVSGLALAQDRARPQRPGRGAVLPPDLAEKLALTAEQKGRIDKIQADFQAKQQEAQARVREALEKARRDMDREAFRKAGEELAKTREELEKQVKDVLNDEQKKKFDELMQQGRQNRPGRPGARFGPPRPGVILSESLQERLDLTAQQKEHLAQLQKEVDAKLNSILTEEQKKRLTAPEGPRRRPRQQ